MFVERLWYARMCQPRHLLVCCPGLISTSHSSTATASLTPASCSMLSPHMCMTRWEVWVRNLFTAVARERGEWEVVVMATTPLKCSTVSLRKVNFHLDSWYHKSDHKIVSPHQLLLSFFLIFSFLFLETFHQHTSKAFLFMTDPRPLLGRASWNCKKV